LLAVGLPQHPDEHRSERPVLLAVDQEFSKVYLCARRRHDAEWVSPVREWVTERSPRARAGTMRQTRKRRRAGFQHTVGPAA